MFDKEVEELLYIIGFGYVSETKMVYKDYLIKSSVGYMLYNGAFGAFYNKSELMLVLNEFFKHEIRKFKIKCLIQ